MPLDHRTWDYTQEINPHSLMEFLNTSPPVGRLRALLDLWVAKEGK